MTRSPWIFCLRICALRNGSRRSAIPASTVSVAHRSSGPFACSNGLDGRAHHAGGIAAGCARCGAFPSDLAPAKPENGRCSVRGGGGRLHHQRSLHRRTGNAHRQVCCFLFSSMGAPAGGLFALATIFFFYRRYQQQRRNEIVKRPFMTIRFSSSRRARRQCHLAALFSRRLFDGPFFLAESAKLPATPLFCPGR